MLFRNNGMLSKFTMRFDAFDSFLSECDFLIVALFVVESAELPTEAIGVGEAVGTDAASQYLATLLYLHHLYRGLYIFLFHILLF